MGSSCTKETGVTEVTDESTSSIARTSLDVDGARTVAISSTRDFSHHASSQEDNNENDAGDTIQQAPKPKKRRVTKLFEKLISSKTKVSDDEAPIFVYFSLLSDDVVLCILSYVSYAPAELDISGTLTLSMLENPSSYRNKPEMIEAQRLIQDYNVGARKLDKALSKRNLMSPFRAPQHYMHEAFHGETDKTEKHQKRINSPRRFGSLTHILPLVNKRIYRLCKNFDVFWKEAIQRLLMRKNWYSQDGFNDLFEKGIISFIDAIDDGASGKSKAGDKGSEDSNVQQTEQQDDLERAQSVVAKVCLLARDSGHGRVWDIDPSLVSDSIGALSENSPGVVARSVLREVLVNHKQTRLPVFVAPYRLKLGNALELRLYEYRYQLLITELMIGRPERERKGFPISEPRPRFLFCCRPHMEVTAACIVEVRQCMVRHDGTADIMLMPMSWVLLEKMTVRPDSGSLREAIVNQRPKRARLPVFQLRRSVTLGQPIGFRFFEPRYQMLVAEIMSGRPDNERDGTNLSEPLPQFVYACASPLEEGNVACIVEVRQCLVRPDGTADLTVVPSCWVLIEQLKLRPYFQGLLDATVLHP